MITHCPVCGDELTFLAELNTNKIYCKRNTIVRKFGHFSWIIKNDRTLKGFGDQLNIWEDVTDWKIKIDHWHYDVEKLELTFSLAQIKPDTILAIVFSSIEEFYQFSLQTKENGFLL